MIHAEVGFTKLGNKKKVESVTTKDDKRSTPSASKPTVEVTQTAGRHEYEEIKLLRQREDKVSSEMVYVDKSVKPASDLEVQAYEEAGIVLVSVRTDSGKKSKVWIDSSDPHLINTKLISRGVPRFELSQKMTLRDVIDRTLRVDNARIKTCIIQKIGIKALLAFSTDKPKAEVKAECSPVISTEPVGLLTHIEEEVKTNPPLVQTTITDSIMVAFLNSLPEDNFFLKCYKDVTCLEDVPELFGKLVQITTAGAVVPSGTFPKLRRILDDAKPADTLSPEIIALLSKVIDVGERIH